MTTTSAAISSAPVPAPVPAPDTSAATATRPWPEIILGGMGVGISNWRLASSVARYGHLGVVSGTAIERLVAYRLQEGDQDGHLRRAFAAFPDQAVAQRVLATWFQPNGLPAAGSYRPLAMFGARPSPDLLALTVVAAFAEIWLARDGHTGPVGLNLLEKIQSPTLPTLYGAVLAGVDYVVVGAGIPRDVPDQLDALCQHQPATLKLALTDGGTQPVVFDPGQVLRCEAPLARPRFLAVVGSHVLAASLARGTRIDGLIVEGPSAGGHNAPPRGWTPAADGEPAYGPRDAINLERIATLGLPFWLAGGWHDAGALARAKALGATGIQVGTPFAFCAESGMRTDMRRQTLAALHDGTATTVTEGRGSPTGFPFKVVTTPDTIGAAYPGARERQSCVLGYLRTASRGPGGTVVWRCPSEPVDQHVRKGGDADDCDGRRCLCHGLMATAGHPAADAHGQLERPLITAGDLDVLTTLSPSGGDYNAADVLDLVSQPALTARLGTA